VVERSAKRAFREWRASLGAVESQLLDEAETLALHAEQVIAMLRRFGVEVVEAGIEVDKGEEAVVEDGEDQQSHNDGDLDNVGVDDNEEGERGASTESATAADADADGGGEGEAEGDAADVETPAARLARLKLISRFPHVTNIGHSRKFREYCTQVRDPELDAAAAALLERLVFFQTRAMQKDPVKAMARRRCVFFSSTFFPSFC
jgi:hypothetical protein